MTKTLSAEANLLSAVHPFISKHTCVYSILFSLGIALVGIAGIVLSLHMDDSSSILSMTALTVGTILILLALYRAFWKSSELVYTPTGSAIREGSYYVDTPNLKILQEVIKNKNFGQTGISFKGSGNGRMDYMVSKDGKFMAVQLFQFVPYTYEPASDIYYYMDADAQAFRHYLETQLK